ncbi:hypothetical protein OsJ_33889 [Oryza sativa Japonica Group]|uniref:Uncharacterized protein n=1 Tax=Oryza sativa subsp. japonica TaxID=39947 RepID=B9GAP2_ORYSJ|nr:hypothetical protein OsJ_33889 [Oryza sativa Japonica Group]
MVVMRWMAESFSTLDYAMCGPLEPPPPPKPAVVALWDGGSRIHASVPPTPKAAFASASAKPVATARFDNAHPLSRRCSLGQGCRIRAPLLLPTTGEPDPANPEAASASAKAAVIALKGGSVGSAHHRRS